MHFDVHIVLCVELSFTRWETTIMPTERNAPELLTRTEAAEFLGLKAQTLACWATTGRNSLPFIKVGRRSVRYRKSDLQAFLAARTVTNTGEADLL